jgi:hypothetical protein
MRPGIRPVEPRLARRGWRFRPSLTEFESRIVPSYTFPGIAGIALDPSGDVFVSYNNTTRSSGQQQAVAEVGPSGYLVSASIFSTSGSSAFPGALSQVVSSSLPTIGGTGNLLELQPNGQLYAFDPAGGSSSLYDNLAGDSVGLTNVYDVQTRLSDLIGRYG